MPDRRGNRGRHQARKRAVDLLFEAEARGLTPAEVAEARNALAEVRKLDARQIPDQPDEQLKLMRVQLGLLRRGFWPYTVDGRDTRKFSEALRAFQRDEELPRSGILDETTAARLGATAGAAN